MSNDQIMMLIHYHLEQATINEQRALKLYKQTKRRGKALLRSAVDVCSGRKMALRVLLNEIEETDRGISAPEVML
jgi:hypothetical protein